jgi:hypothetical protein
VDLLHQGGELDRDADIAREVDREAQVLGHELHREALVVIAAVQERQDVALEEHGVGRRGDERAVQCGQIDPGLDPDRQRLGGGDSLDEPGEVEQELDGVAAPAGAEQEDPLRVSDRLEHRQRPSEGLGLPARVDRQRPRLGADGLARHGRVEQRDTRGVGLGPGAAADLEGAGAHVDHQ